MKLITTFSKKQCTDAGMALVLLCLLGYVFFVPDSLTIWVAMAALILTMSMPVVLKPWAFVWLNVSVLVGAVMSRLILTMIYFFVVFPVGLIFKIIGKDALVLKKFKNSRASVFVTRNKTFKAEDLYHPF